MDTEFGNEFNNLLTMSDVQDKGTIKVILNSDVPGQSGGSGPAPLTTCSACSSSHPPDDSSSLSSCCSFDTDILSSAESTSSRSSAWPVVFQIPRFSYDTELQLDKANAAFKETGSLLNPDSKHHSQ